MRTLHPNWVIALNTTVTSFSYLQVLRTRKRMFTQKNPNISITIIRGILKRTVTQVVNQRRRKTVTKKEKTGQKEEHGNSYCKPAETVALHQLGPHSPEN